ncbi:MAG: hypothetical protein IT435_04230 [Phycisphaerales bacterium]|nr:hypothetical protein [Phycisphaerales bacterium]
MAEAVAYERAWPLKQPERPCALAAIDNEIGARTALCCDVTVTAVARAAIEPPLLVL